MRNMGGLKKYMPITYWTFLIAALANAGIFPLAGYWSKDEILLGTYLRDSLVGYIIMAVGFTAALFTAIYMFRAVFMTFHGKERFDTHHLHPHESPAVMTVPLVILAVATLLVGPAVGWPPEDGWMHDFLGPVFSTGGEGGHALASTTGAVLAQAEEAEVHHPSNTLLVTFAVISTVVALAGIGIAYLAYIKQSVIFSPTVWATRFRPLYVLFLNKFYFDEIYEYCIVHPLYWVSDRVLWQVVDIRIIDGAVNGVASLFSYSSSQLRRVQTGFVANYALAIAIGAVVIVGVYFVFASSLFS